MKKILLLAVAGTLTLTSCIKDEAMNAECDITGIDSLWLQNHYNDIKSTMVRNSSVTVTIYPGTDRTAFDPKFTLTPGATITYTDGSNELPGNGAVRDFSRPQIYTTHSEDGLWKKDYTVSFIYDSPLKELHFENFSLEEPRQRYHNWYELDTEDPETPQRPYWASGNAGFALTGKGKQPSDYPTAIDAEGVSGYGVRLVTRDTGSFGSGVKMPIAAGNIFIGEFNASSAMLAPRKATKFGRELVFGRPLYLEGWYKYTAGDVVTDAQKKQRPELRDTADIYAVVFEKDNLVTERYDTVSNTKFTPLNGDDVLTSPRIVAMARIDNPGEPAEWTKFKEPFRLMNGKDFDEKRIRNNGYAIAIVATSSRQGAYFIGAIGSTLCIDEFRIIWEGDDDATE